MSCSRYHQYNQRPVDYQRPFHPQNVSCPASYSNLEQIGKKERIVHLWIIQCTVFYSRPTICGKKHCHKVGECINQSPKCPKWLPILAQNCGCCTKHQPLQPKAEGYGFRVMMDHVLSWIITVFDRSIQSKKDMLFGRKPGAITPGEPKIIGLKLYSTRKQKTASPDSMASWMMSWL